MIRVAVIACALVSLLAPRASAGVVTLASVRDNTLFEDANGDTSNGAGPAFFAGVNSQGRTRRALLAFDLARQVPADAVIDSVVLTLEVTSAPDTVARLFTLHRMLANWGEGSSSSAGGSGAPATPGDATWLHAFYPDVSWFLPGGDFDPTPSADQIVGDVGTWSWSGAGIAADVRGWIENPASNFGWLIRGNERVTRSVRRFDSRETGIPLNVPTLTIHFSLPVAARTASWGGIKARYR